MRAPIYTLVALIALLAAIWSSSLGAFDTGPAAAPLTRDEATADVSPAPFPMVTTELLAPVAGARSDTTADVDLQAGTETLATPSHMDAGARRPTPTAWAAYDPRAERNARYRAERLPRALLGLTAEGTNASLRVAYAISIETAAIFSELDERRESIYVPDDGQMHPMKTQDGHHSVACGGASYCPRPARGREQLVP
jgi:hypothetical protein